MELILIYTIIAAGVYLIWRYMKRRRITQEKAGVISANIPDITEAISSFPEQKNQRMVTSRTNKYKNGKRNMPT